MKTEPNPRLYLSDIMERLYAVKEEQRTFSDVCAVQACIEAVESLAKQDPLESVRRNLQETKRNL